MTGPQILIEWLKNVMWLGQGLSKAERERDFAVRQVTDDFAEAPFAGRVRLIRVVFAHRVQDFTHFSGCNGDHLAWIAGTEIRSVRIHRNILQK